MEPASPSQVLSDLLVKSVDVLAQIAPSLNKESFGNSLERNLAKLEAQWEFLADVLSTNFDDNCTPMQLLDRFKWMRHCKNGFYMLCQKFSEIESRLSEMLDTIEGDMAEYMQSEQMEVFMEVFESCWYGMSNLKPILRSSKAVFEAGLEYNEIMSDHLGSLDTLIDENTEKCVQIMQNLGFLNNTFTEFASSQRLSVILTECADTGFSRVPSSSQEKDVLDGFAAVLETMSTLENSLDTVSSVKIKQFDLRSIRNKQFLLEILHQKYQKVSGKYNNLISVCGELKKDLIDSRWETLFKNLNTAVEVDIEQVEGILDCYKTDGAKQIPRGLAGEKLSALSISIEKSFNIIYQALPFSVLTIEVATKANELASRWLVLGNQIEILDLKADEKDDLASGLRRLSLQSVSSEGNRSTSSQSRSKGVGAHLFERMNIKPVIVHNTPKSAEKRSSFYRSDSTELQPVVLNFEKAPKLLRSSSIEKDTKSCREIAISFEILLTRISLFSLKTSQIPIYHDAKIDYYSTVRLKLNSPMKVALKSLDNSPIQTDRYLMLPTLSRLHKQF